MEYRRFGKTNKNISVITLGGMRFKHAWEDPRDELPQESIDQCTDTVKQAFSHGINLIETAFGYKKSEHLYGHVLNNVLNVNRSDYYLMTKGAPDKSENTRSLIEKQLKALKTDYFDFYGWHGINDNKTFQKACGKGGSVYELLKLKEEGIIKHLGFSTHGPLQIILDAINTDLFDFVNLHYYYFFQHNKPAIDLAAEKDMGVFIISPNDKGGQLSKSPKKLRELTRPLTPVQFNAKFCLSNSDIHTLTFGLPETCSFDELSGILPASAPLTAFESIIKAKLDNQINTDKYAHYEGYEMLNDPSNINIPEILRFRKMWKCFDMKDFGLYRYNMFKEKDNWFQGAFATDDKLKLVDTSKCPKDIPIIELLRETHKALYKPKTQK